MLKIMYAPSDLQGVIPSDVEQDAKRLASEIYTRFEILVKNVANTTGHLHAIVEEARWTDLLVVGELWERLIAGSFCAHPVERLQRLVACPVLFARLEANHPYQRMLVAIDSAPDSRKLLEVAGSLDRNAEVESFHARHAEYCARSQSDSELIVVGRRRRFGLSDFLFRSAAHRVLSRSKGDVLLVPHDLRIEPKPAIDAPSKAAGSTPPHLHGLTP
ncbi:MAG: universal stress protein [Variovorax sp.]|nr:universal stress protein [Variovorax sp.]